ncbi:hypothetical protein [Enterococcus casseliflavus]|uniref:hypothetical protein n=1 Tax=Enterococcus casseliflavus TaxID=37734 RepID=UPI003D13F6A8
MSTKTNKSELLKNIHETLDSVRLGIDLYTHGKGQERKAGLRNAVVFGRAVTSSIQKYKGLVDHKEFDIWYAKWQSIMKQDPGMKYLYRLRSVILKEGILRVGTNSFINELTPENIEEYFKLAPPNAINFFIGDEYGGTGFTVVGNNGEESKYYISLPDNSNIGANLEMIDVPHYTTYNGTSINSTKSLLDFYYQFLGVMVKDLELKFS